MDETQGYGDREIQEINLYSVASNFINIHWIRTGSHLYRKKNIGSYYRQFSSSNNKKVIKFLPVLSARAFYLSRVTKHLNIFFI